MDIRIVPDARLPFDVRIVRDGQAIAKVYGIDAQPNPEAEKIAELFRPQSPPPGLATAIENYLRSVGWANDDLDYEAFALAVAPSLPEKPEDIAYCIGCGTYPKGGYTCATCVAADEHEGEQAHVSDWPERV